MNQISEKSSLRNWLRLATFLPGLAAGLTRSDSRNGPTTTPSGQPVSHASHGRRQANGKDERINVTYGEPFTTLCLPASQPSSLENKSPALTLSDLSTKICTVCKLSKPLSEYREYSGRGKRGLRPLCKPCQRAYERTWRSMSKENRRLMRAKRRDKAGIYARQYRAQFRARYLIASCRKRSAKKGWAFDLDLYETEIQARMDAGKCELSGIALNLEPTKGRRFNSPSIDRINPTQGYIYDNIRVICFAMNAFLGDWGEATALEVATAWVRK